MSTLVFKRNAESLQVEHSVHVSFTHIVLIFFACSLLGLFVETIVSFFIDGRWESRAGFVLLPLSPIYGIGAVLMTMVVNPLRGKNAVLQFLAAAFIGGVFEYLAGWLLESCFGIVAWSYEGQLYNFHGHTSVGMSLVWGIVGFVWGRWMLPWMVGVIDCMPRTWSRRLAVGLFAIMLVDAVLTLGALDCWYLRTCGQVPASFVEQFFATCFNDAYMTSHFETMSMWPVLAQR